jgi:glycosyltransferase involved in cell wall biosynthesis
MATGLPVVATKKGAEGLNLVNGSHLLYAESREEFQAAILRLLCDQPQREKLSAQAEVLVKSRFDWTQLLRRFALQLQS